MTDNTNTDNDKDQAQQLELSGEHWPAPVFLSSETPKRWTGAQLRRHRPDVAAAIPLLYNAGATYATLQSAFNISPDTIRSILLSSKVVADRARESLALDFRHSAARLNEHLHELLDDKDTRAKIDAKTSAFAAATLAERSDAMQGKATQIFDISVDDAGRDEFSLLVMGLEPQNAGTMREGGKDGEDRQAESGPPAIDAEFREVHTDD